MHRYTGRKAAAPIYPRSAMAYYLFVTLAHAWKKVEEEQILPDLVCDPERLSKGLAFSEADSHGIQR